MVITLLQLTTAVALLAATGKDGVAAATGFVNTDAHTKYAAWSVVATMNGTLSTNIGLTQKHPANPLLVQDQPWELRLDNGYPNIIHHPDDPLGAYRYETANPQRTPPVPICPKGTPIPPHFKAIGLFVDLPPLVRLTYQALLRRILRREGFRHQPRQRPVERVALCK